MDTINDESRAGKVSSGEDRIYKDEYSRYQEAFRDRLVANGLPADVVETVEAAGSQLYLELTAYDPTYRVGISLPDDLGVLLRGIFKFPFKVVKIAIGFKESQISIWSDEVARSAGQIAGDYRQYDSLSDAIVDFKLDSKEPIYCSKLRVDHSSNRIFVGTLASLKIGGMPKPEEKWTPRNLSGLEVVAFRHLVQNAGNIPHTSAAIVIKPNTSQVTSK